MVKLYMQGTNQIHSTAVAATCRLLFMEVGTKAARRLLRHLAKRLG